MLCRPAWPKVGQGPRVALRFSVCLYVCEKESEEKSKGLMFGRSAFESLEMVSSENRGNPVTEAVFPLQFFAK